MYTGIEIVITPDDTDVLKAFTTWIDIVSTHAQSGFCRQNRHMDNEVLMDELPDESLLREDHDLNRVAVQQGALSDLFAFEEERPSNAFSQLSLLRQRILGQHRTMAKKNSRDLPVWANSVKNLRFFFARAT